MVSNNKASSFHEYGDLLLLTNPSDLTNQNRKQHCGQCSMCYGNQSFHLRYFVSENKPTPGWNSREINGSNKNNAGRTLDEKPGLGERRWWQKHQTPRWRQGLLQCLSGAWLRQHVENPQVLRTAWACTASAHCKPRVWGEARQLVLCHGCFRIQRLAPCTLDRVRRQRSWHYHPPKRRFVYFDSSIDDSVIPDPLVYKQK